MQCAKSDSYSFDVEVALYQCEALRGCLCCIPELAVASWMRLRGHRTSVLHVLQTKTSTAVPVKHAAGSFCCWALEGDFHRIV